MHEGIAVSVKIVRELGPKSEQAYIWFGAKPMIWC